MEKLSWRSHGWLFIAMGAYALLVAFIVTVREMSHLSSWPVFWLVIPFSVLFLIKRRWYLDEQDSARTRWSRPIGRMDTVWEDIPLIASLLWMLMLLIVWHIIAIVTGALTLGRTNLFIYPFEIKKGSFVCLAWSVVALVALLGRPSFLAVSIGAVCVAVVVALAARENRHPNIVS